MDKPSKSALFGLALNVAFSAYYLACGLILRSWWMLTLGSYYLILSVVRFAVLRTKSKEHLAAKMAGWMLMALSLSLVGTVILSVVRDRGHERHTIIMIGLAAYAFTKMTLAIIRLIQCRHSASQKIVALRNIDLADALASIFALQRSMLVSFEGMTDTEIVIMNATLGSAVCIAVFLLGLHLAKKRQDHPGG